MYFLQEDEETQRTRRRYDRLLGRYDRVGGLMEKWAFGPWRQQLWTQVHAEHIL